MDTISNQTETLQLQFWDASKKTYVPQADAPVGRYRAWRRVLASKNWVLKNPKYRARRPNRPTRSVAQVQAAYCNWAQAKGLKSITAYAGKYCDLGSYTGAVNRITLEAHFAVTVEELPSC